MAQIMTNDNLQHAEEIHYSNLYIRWLTRTSENWSLRWNKLRRQRDVLVRMGLSDQRIADIQIHARDLLRKGEMT